MVFQAGPVCNVFAQILRFGQQGLAKAISKSRSGLSFNICLCAGRQPSNFTRWL